MSRQKKTFQFYLLLNSALTGFLYKMWSLSFSVDHIPISHTVERISQVLWKSKKSGPNWIRMSVPHLTKHKTNLGEHSSQNQLEAIGALIRRVNCLFRDDINSWNHPQKSDRHVSLSLRRGEMTTLYACGRKLTIIGAFVQRQHCSQSTDWWERIFWQTGWA